MKNYINIIITVLFLVLIGTVCSLISENSKQKDEIARQEQNFKQLDSNFATLNLTKDELQSKVIQSDNRIRTADSILLQRDIKISQLQKLHVATVVITNKDTVYLTNTDTLYVRIKKDSTLYKTAFTDERNCMKIEGFVMSTDEFPSVAITSQNAEIETYEIEVHRKWYQFWKPKTWTETFTKCGNLKVLQVNKTK